MLVLLLLLATADAKKPRPDPDEGSSGAATAVDPGAGRSALEPPGPPLEGPNSGLQLEALRRVSTTFTFGVDTSPLAGLDRASVDRLERHLAADPRWRVVERDGSVVAVQRVQGAKGWTVGPTETHVGKGRCHRIALRFGPLGATNPWRTAYGVAHADVGTDEITLVAFGTEADPCKGQAATALDLADPALGLEVYESNDGKARPVTTEALQLVLELVATLAFAPDAIDAQGFDPFSMPADEPVAGGPTVAVTSPGPGLLELRGRVNPAARGWVWLRLLDGGGAPWEIEVVGRGTRERSGWSGDPADTFLVQGVFAAPTGPGWSGTAELWFRADSGGKPTLLHSAPVTVPGR